MTVPAGWHSSRKSAMILAKLPGGKSAKSGIRRKTVARESITTLYLPRRGASGKHAQEGRHCPPYSLDQKEVYEEHLYYRRSSARVSPWDCYVCGPGHHCYVAAFLRLSFACRAFLL